jgi:hypothetical protein
LLNSSAEQHVGKHHLEPIINLHQSVAPTKLKF